MQGGSQGLSWNLSGVLTGTDHARTPLGPFGIRLGGLIRICDPNYTMLCPKIVQGLRVPQTHRLPVFPGILIMGKFLKFFFGTPTADPGPPVPRVNLYIRP